MAKTLPPTNRVYHADALAFCRALPDACMDLVFTSPPYYLLRDYQVEGQIGHESTLPEFLDRILSVTAEMSRILKPAGALFLNIGDRYARYCDPSGIPPKSLMLIPARLAVRLIDEQRWIIRNDIIWVKANPKPSSARDRFINAHEHLFFCVKQPVYGFDDAAVRRPYKPATIKRMERALKNGINPSAPRQDPAGFAEDPHSILRNMARRWLDGKMRGTIPTDVWTVHTNQFNSEHLAAFPEQLCELAILACCPSGGIVFDPFIGSGTTGAAAKRLGRDFLGCDLNENYVRLANARILGAEASDLLQFPGGSARYRYEDCLNA